VFTKISLYKYVFESYGSCCLANFSKENTELFLYLYLVHILTATDQIMENFLWVLKS